MAGQIELNAERNALEMQLLALERVIEDRQQHGIAVPEMADCVVSLLLRLKLVNTKLAELRGPAAPA
jgi:hypothetical protein